MELEIKEYCHECEDFEPIVVGGIYYADSIPYMTADRKVRCKHWKRCEYAVRNAKITSNWLPGCYCKNCKYEARFAYKYCPSCGAEMEDGSVG